MFEKKIYAEDKIDEQIDNVYATLVHLEPDTSDYSDAFDKLERLYKLKKMNSSDPVDINTVLAVTGNLVGIVLIVGYERSNIIRSAAMNFVKKLC